MLGSDYIRVLSGIWISHRQFPRKSHMFDRITPRVITHSFTPVGKNCGNWFRFSLRQMSRNSHPLKGSLCEHAIPNLFFPKQINTVENTKQILFTSRDEVQLLLDRFKKQFENAVQYNETIFCSSFLQIAISSTSLPKSSASHFLCPEPISHADIQVSLINNKDLNLTCSKFQSLS